MEKTTVVCGSTQGIGKAMAKAGAETVLVARNEARLQEAVAELNQETGLKHRYLIADFPQPEGLNARLSTFAINNTGGPSPGSRVEDQSFRLLRGLPETPHL